VPPDAVASASERLADGDARRDAGDPVGAGVKYAQAKGLLLQARAAAKGTVAAREAAANGRREAVAALHAWQVFRVEEPLAPTEDAERGAQRFQDADASLRAGDDAAAAEGFVEAARLLRGAVEGGVAAIEAALAARQEAPAPGGSVGERALAWLARHQDDAGSWDCDGFERHDPADDRCDGRGGALFDVGVTGLALLAFLEAGQSDRAEDSYYALNVRRALAYLRRAQDDDGVFGTRATHYFMYNHAIAAQAMVLAYARTSDPRYKSSAQRALRFLEQARSKSLGWRYEPAGEESDTSLTAWCFLALRAGRDAGLTVSDECLAGALAWVEKMTDPDFGQVGYDFPGGNPSRVEGLHERFPTERTQSMTAAGLVIRLYSGVRLKSSAPAKRGVALCQELLPVWNPDNGSIDMYYWFYGTKLFARLGGREWKRWRAALRDVFERAQHPPNSGARTGSFDPIGAWGEDGGRVYATAIMALCALLVDGE